MKKKEVYEEMGKLNEIKIISKQRSDGTVSHALDFSNCPTLTEQHTAHLSDINYLMEKYRPDELAAYLTARNQHRQEIIGHDFSVEPNLQDAKNLIYTLKSAFEELSPELRNQFRNHVEFLKFVDNPANADKLVKMGLISKKSLEKLIPPPQNANDQTNAIPTPNP